MKTNNGYGAILTVQTATKSQRESTNKEIAVSNTAIS
jgi:hypothetical protein